MNFVLKYNRKSSQIPSVGPPPLPVSPAGPVENLSVTVCKLKKKKKKNTKPIKMSDKGLSEEDVAAACKDADPMTKVRPNISLNASHRNFCRCQTEAGRQLQLHRGADGQLRVHSGSCRVVSSVYACLFSLLFYTYRSRESRYKFKTAVHRDNVTACGC